MQTQMIELQTLRQQRDARQEQFLRALMEAYWHTVEDYGRHRAATILASGGRRDARSTSKLRRAA